MNRLLDMHIADMRRMKRSDIAITEQRIDKHLRPVFGKLDATAIKKTDIKSYIDARIATGAANATINRELSAIRRAFSIGVDDELLTKAPKIKPLPENNARQGYIEAETYTAMLSELPEHAKLPWVFSYFTGMRKGELLRLEWAWVDWSRWVIEVPAAITKSKKKRIIPVYDDMREYLQKAFTHRNPACPFIFQMDGQRIKSFRTAFENARVRLALPKLLFHDLRRTAVRNMERAGIPRTTARQVSGHLTESIHIRYAISGERDALEVGERMTAFHQSERTKAGMHQNCGTNCGMEIQSQERNEAATQR